MKPRFFTLILIGLLLAACTRPFNSAPTPFLFPTPDLTLTAIYSVLTPSAPEPTFTPTAQLPHDGGAATATSQSPAASATPETVPTQTPTATSVPPTATNPPPTSTTPPQPTPTNTPVPLLVRPKGQVTAYYFTSPPSLDGNFSEWSSAKIYPAHAIVYGKDNWSGNPDLQGNFQVGWDASNLYLAVSVSDQLYVQMASGGEMYKGDSIEILMDTNQQADFYVESLSPDDYQLGISPGNPAPSRSPEAFLWFPSTISGGRSVQIYASVTSDGYLIEAAIPWSTFGIQPQNGQHYGFALSVSDNDNDAASVQQSLASSLPSRRLTNPTTWGDLYLSR